MECSADTVPAFFPWRSVTPEAKRPGYLLVRDRDERPVASAGLGLRRERDEPESSQPERKALLAEYTAGT